MRKLMISLTFSIVWCLGSAGAAAAVAVYEYDGNNFDNVTDEDPPAGTFDTSMRVTGSVTFVDELAPNLIFGDVTGDVLSYELDDGRLAITSLTDSDAFSFFVATDGAGTIVSWAIFGEALLDLGGQLLQTHQIVSRTTAGGLDRGIRFIDDETETRLGTDIGLNGNPGDWTFLPEPSSALLAVSALTALFWVRRRVV